MTLRQAVAVICLALLAPCIEAASTDVMFEAPMRLEGLVDARTMGSLTASSSSQATISLTGSVIQFEERTTQYSTGVDGVIAIGPGFFDTPWKPVGNPGPGTALLTAPEPWGIRVTGGEHRIESGDLHFEQIVPAGNSPSMSTGPHSPYPLVSGPPVHSEQSLLFTGNEVTRIRTNGTFQIELFSFDGNIQRSDRSTVESGFVAHESTPTGDQLGVIKYARLTVSDGSFVLETDAAKTAVVSSISSVVHEGDLYIPLAEGAILNGDQLPDGTWHANGSLELNHMRPSGPRVASAQLTAEDGELRLDGSPVDLSATSPTIATVSTLGALALAFALLKAAPAASALLTRLPPEKALENKNRKALFEYILDHPGATFREVLRGTDIAAGTARHHLTVLARSKMIVEHGHRATLRYFENHGKFDATWASVVLLREPELAQVHAWLAAHPDANQKDLLAHAESAWSWSRSTTQHRLARLIDGGLVTFRQAGRRKFYQAVAPEAAQPPSQPKASWT